LLLPAFHLPILFGLPIRITLVLEIGLDEFPNRRWDTGTNVKRQILHAKIRPLEQLGDWNASKLRPESG